MSGHRVRMRGSLVSGHVAAWLWFGIAVLFILAVMFSRWREREHSDQAETERQLAKTRPHVGDSHIWDAS